MGKANERLTAALRRNRAAVWREEWVGKLSTFLGQPIAADRLADLERTDELMRVLRDRERSLHDPDAEWREQTPLWTIEWRVVGRPAGEEP